MPPNIRPPRPPLPTHFLCIPLVTPSSRPQLSRALAGFRTDVCGASSSLHAASTIPEDAIRPVGTLHLTLGVFSFPPPSRGSDGDGVRGNEDLGRAVELLRGIRLGEVLAEVDARLAAQSVGVMPGDVRSSAGDGDGPGVGVGTEKEGVGGENDGMGNGKGKGKEDQRENGLRITLKGLRSMQADPAKATVLYAPPVDPLGRLQAFCERIKGVFREAGLMTDEGRALLLHATVVNTVYVRGRKDRGRGKGTGGDRKGERIKVDAREVLDRYEEEVWMEDMCVESVAICKMGAKKMVVDGEEDEAYEVEADVKFSGEVGT